MKAAAVSAELASASLFYDNPAVFHPGFGAGLIRRLKGIFLCLHPSVKGFDQFAVNLREIDVLRRFLRKPESLDKITHDCPPSRYIRVLLYINTLHIKTAIFNNSRAIGCFYNRSVGGCRAYRNSVSRIIYLPLMMTNLGMKIKKASG
jgi:hypothetical protein